MLEYKQKYLTKYSNFNNSLESFIDLFYNNSILFLNKELKPKYQNREIYNKLPESDTARGELKREIEEIFMNNRLYVYSLNIRGLILYILGEVEHESTTNSKRQKAKRRKVNYNSKISKVIENLAEHYWMKFPFLYNYKEMRNIISKIPNKHFENHFEIKILRKIAEELKHQIHFDERYSNSKIDSNNNVINYWITKRYFSEISYYFAYLCMALPDDKKNEFNNLFRDFQNRMVILMKEYLKKEQESLRYVV